MANLNLYKSFYDVVRYDGFNNASKATNISQPALSYSIKTLENELNTILIYRTNNQFKITEEGKILILL
jgi:DNA-binding transcriptional LysR family regulator